ncbi:aminoglycoside 6-adenylyltransferase [Chryseobacterium sp. 09-1422]|uniref:Aminoglycoside 6-adenylyltransferase n=1 Tax=Chryseobacterium kimseyorum TaxID=2984028 RepID=A0ABT3I0T2_9FLAO|nr:aminoglycoside 6-adenylyltransferase [Chryseobacterium kimseyorum]MCW3169652.1 aminoglycoside 6-adenylyltransferase [Chryseobacterium kimseyorum]
MRNQIEIYTTILDFAKADDRIRAVLLNGSRANSNVAPDKYQDFDIMFIINDLDSFIIDRSWINTLGKPLLQQLPDEMELGKDAHDENFSFRFLIMFEDQNRIDLTLFPYEKIKTDFKTDSLTIALLDKDYLFNNIPKPSDKDYHITKPNQREFSEVCNEFWWCITNVAKGLKRGEMIYAKDMLETVVRPMFWQIIEWNIGNENDFKVSIGKSGKFAKNFLTHFFYENILKTYSDSNIENNWNSLELMTTIFKEQQEKLAKELNLKNNLLEAENSIKYIKNIRTE